MKHNYRSMLILLFVLLITVSFSGCTVTFTANNSLQFNISKPTEKTESLIADFESGEDSSVAGDATQKSGSVCAGGACIIY